MKMKNYLLVFALLSSFFSCKKEEINNPDVDSYIRLLKTNKYESIYLPEFSSKDIPALMSYIYDNSVVNKFPSNPVSSYALPLPDYRLGILVLWTIESIRVVSSGQKHVMRFPSQNPFIQTKTAGRWITDHDDEAYNFIRQAYSNWWHHNKFREFDSFCQMNPLENTNYQWH
jgi:hypothetical protein